MCRRIRRVRRVAFLSGMAVMAGMVTALVAGSYMLSLLGQQVAHWALP